MTTNDQRPAEDELQEISDKLFHAFVDQSYATMKQLSENYNSRIAISIVLMTAANFVVQSHFAAGMTRETVLDLLKGAIDDAEAEKEVAPN